MSAKVSYNYTLNLYAFEGDRWFQSSIYLCMYLYMYHSKYTYMIPGIFDMLRPDFAIEIGHLFKKIQYFFLFKLHNRTIFYK